jgi:drug/metabolite transporter (DMT)-like permease
MLATPFHVQIIFMIMGSCGHTLFHLTVALALKYGDASKMSILISTDLLFAFLLQIAILGVIPNVLEFAGAIIIAFSTMLITIFKIVDCNASENMRNSRIGKIIFYKF